jgi:quercetin dioxygenase-like cupin family protein
MRKLFTKSSLCIAAGATVSGISTEPETLHVTSGRVWVTVEGQLDDYWLQAGESITVDADRLIVIEADKADSRVNLPLLHDGRRSFDFFTSLRDWAGTNGNIGQNTQQANC